MRIQSFNSLLIKKLITKALSISLMGLLPAAGAGWGADYLIVDGAGGAGAGTDTFNMDGTSGDGRFKSLIADPAVQINGGNNAIDNVNGGVIEGTIKVAKGGVNIYNGAGSTIKAGAAPDSGDDTDPSGGGSYAIQGVPDSAETPASGTGSGSGDDTPPAFDYVNVVLNNAGNVEGQIAVMGTLKITNQSSGKITGTGGAAIQLTEGKAVIDNYGKITATVAEDADTPATAILIGENATEDPAAASGTGTTPTGDEPQPANKPLTAELYHHAGAEITGGIENHGNLHIHHFKGAMTGDILNQGTINVGLNQVRFTGNYSHAAASTDTGSDAGTGTGTPAEAPETRGALIFNINNGEYGSLHAVAQRDAAGEIVSGGEIDLSGTDVTINARGGIAGQEYAVVTADKYLTTHTSAGGEDAEAPDDGESAARITLNAHSLTLDYRTFQTANTLGVIASARPRAFTNNSFSGDRRLGNYLDAIATAPGQLASTLWRLNGITDRGQLQRAVASINDRVSANARTQMMLNAVSEHMNATKSLLRELGSNQLAAFSQGTAKARAAAGGVPLDNYGQTGDYGFYRWNTFVRAYGGFGSQDTVGDEPGYDFRNAGVLAGLDYAIAREFRCGIFGGYSWNHTEINGKFGETTDLLARAGLYGTLNWDGAYIDIAPTFGLHRLDTQRRIRIGDWQTTADNVHYSWDINLLLNAGLTINLPGRTYFTPEFSLSPTVFHSPDYHEHGAAENLNLAIASYNSWSLLQTLRFRLGTMIDLGCGTQLKPEFTLGWEHEYLDAAGETTCAFVGAPYSTWRNDMTAIDRDRLLIGLGLSALVMDDLSIYARWDQRIWGSGYSCAFTAGAAYGF